MTENLQAGFVYTVEEFAPDGALRSTETIHNLMPVEGLNHMLGVTLKGGTQYTTWYIGLYEGNYTPTVNDTATEFPAAATECTTYVAGARPEFVEGAVAGGACSNSAAPAEFVSTANKTVYGGFISSSSAKGAASGVLLSAVRFASPKTFDTDSTLRVTAGFTITSL